MSLRLAGRRALVTGAGSSIGLAITRRCERVLGQPENVADVAALLESGDARFVSAQCIVADGGAT